MSSDEMLARWIYKYARNYYKFLIQTGKNEGKNSQTVKKLK